MLPFINTLFNCVILLYDSVTKNIYIGVGSNEQCQPYWFKVVVGGLMFDEIIFSFKNCNDSDPHPASYAGRLGWAGRQKIWLRFDQCHCINNKNFINKIISQITVYWGPRELRNKTIRLQLTTNIRLMYLCMEPFLSLSHTEVRGGLKKMPDFNSLYSIQMTL